MNTMRKTLMLVGLVVALTNVADAQTSWVQGKNYFLIQPAQPTNVAAGKVEVVEVFSYGCPACFAFYPTMDKLKASLPTTAQLAYVPAAWNEAEDWPMFQRAFYAAQALGLVERTHDAMFDAIWKTYELAIVDPKSGRLKKPLPSIADAAKFYNRVTKTQPDAFLAAANSFGVAANMKHADALVIAYQVDQTPTMIINGKYRVTVGSAGGYDQLIDLVKWLVAREVK